MVYIERVYGFYIGRRGTREYITAYLTYLESSKQPLQSLYTPERALMLLDPNNLIITPIHIKLNQRNLIGCIGGIEPNHRFPACVTRHTEHRFYLLCVKDSRLLTHPKRLLC